MQIEGKIPTELGLCLNLSTFKRPLSTAVLPGTMNLISYIFLLLAPEPKERFFSIIIGLNRRFQPKLPT